MKQRLMELYFTDGADLSDPEILISAAVSCGMNAESVRERLTSDEDIDAVTNQAEAAKQAGVDGVPFFVFDGAFAVSGAQAPEHLADAIRRAAEQRHSAPDPAVASFAAS
jgi:predicted DsbA family dithiol-disulfide isomerase